jgi:hypothetical protein
VKISLDLGPSDDPVSAFRSTYAEARSVTVFWCPTIFRSASDGSSNGEHSLSRFLDGKVADSGSATSRLYAAAKKEVNGYFDTFQGLKGKAGDYLHALDNTLRQAAETGAERLQGLRRGPVLVDLAPSDKYKAIVQRLPEPERCRPSLGFYIDLPYISSSTDDITDSITAAGADLDNLQTCLEFQIEATYTPPPKIDEFLHGVLRVFAGM